MGMGRSVEAVTTSRWTYKSLPNMEIYLNDGVIIVRSEVGHYTPEIWVDLQMFGVAEQ